MKYCKLIDVCDFQGGSQPPKSDWVLEPKDGYVRMLQIRDFTQNYDKPEYVKITNSIKLCSEDDILIARYGASVGKILTGLSGAYNVAIMKTIPNEEILTKKYLFYFLKSNLFQKYILNVGSRAAQAGFNKEDLSGISIQIHSLKEQETIVNQLENIDKLIKFRNDEIEKLNNLIKSQFVEMFGDISINSRNYKTNKLNEISNCLTGGTPSTSNKDFYKGDIPWITTVSLGKNYIDKSDAVSFITENAIKNSSTKLIDKNSILFGARVGVGKCSINSVPLCTNQDIVAITNISKDYNLIFLKHVLDQYNEYFNNQKRGATIKGIKSDTLKKIDIPVVDINTQNKFAQIVEQIDKQKFVGIKVARLLGKIAILC